jgi:ribonuclease BN (tRNA processing enzyme)
MSEISEALFPGMHVMQPRFPLQYVELEVGKPNRIRDLVVIPQVARHTRETNPLALRVEVAGKVVAYTGDGEWTDDLAKIGRDADLLIAECYYYAKPVRWHLNYLVLAEHLRDVGARRVILTHMSQEMLAHAAEIPEECAHDGLVVDV